MSISNESPIFEFLIKKENLINVLEIIRHGTEVREHVRTRFWEKLKNEIGKSRPKDLTLKFQWDDEWKKETKHGCFTLGALVSPAGEKTQGLQYAIEAYPTYFGIGLRRIDKKTDVYELSKIPVAVTLRDEVLKHRQGNIEQEPQEWWLWFEHWSEEPCDDISIWFAEKTEDTSFFATTAKKFWEFVQPTYALVLKINEAANNPNRRAP